jgi:DNA-binding MarR family transcriptional regulator
MRAAEFAARDLATRSGLTPSQIVVLQIIAQEGEAGAGSIADTAQISQATVTVLLDKLEALKLVTRRRGEIDRRRVTAKVTDAGRKVLAETPDVLQNRFVARFERLLDWEQAAVIAALERVAELLNAEGIDAAPILDIGPLEELPELGKLYPPQTITKKK